ncbi:MAG: hypothetical protein QM704_25205 [Anaeromyxobacteraceae bacterium]
MTAPASLRGPARALALAAALALGLGAGRARAAAPLQVDLAVRGDRLQATLDLAPAFPPEVLRELGNGLSNVVAVYVVVVPEGGGAPVAGYLRTVDVLWDVWEESFAVTVRDPRNPRGLQLVVPTPAGLRALLASARDLDLGPAASLPPGKLVLEARVELNPVSKEQLQRTREFIASAGPRAAGGGSRSVLGAMASFLLREPAADADVWRLRSKAFTAAEVAR